MTTVVNDLNNDTSEYHQYSNEPPGYCRSSSALTMWNVSTVMPNNQIWDDSPPAYDSLSDLPIWSTSASNLSSPPTVQPWDFSMPFPQYSTNSPELNEHLMEETSDTVFRDKFRKGKPLPVGVLLLLCSFGQLGVGIFMPTSEDRIHLETLKYGIPFWTSALHITTGSVLIAAHLTPTFCRVKASIILAILSVILSCVGLIFSIRDLSALCRKGDIPGCSNRAVLSSFEIQYIFISGNVVILCLSASVTIIASYVLYCLPRGRRQEGPQPLVNEDTFFGSILPPEFPQTPPSLPSPPPYTAVEIPK